MEPAEIDALPTGLAAAWGLKPRRSRGPKPDLSLEKIVDAAIAVADAEGLEAMSMSRVAAELGYSPMSLYRYVASKEELLVLAVDRGTGRPPAPVPGDDWRAALSRWAIGQLDAFERHPWALHVPIGSTGATPNFLAWMDAGLAALADTPLSELDKMTIIGLIAGSGRHQALARDDLQRQLARAGVSGEREWSSLLERFADATRFPALARAIAGGGFVPIDPYEDLRLGLEVIFDGVASAIARAEPRRRRRPSR
jgi:AcrR family transcriptional regulator